MDKEEIKEALHKLCGKTIQVKSVSFLASFLVEGEITYSGHGFFKVESRGAFDGKCEFSEDFVKEIVDGKIILGFKEIRE